MAETTLYDILELTSSADSEEIKAAYRRLSTQVHPDRGGSGALFRLVREAYEILSDDSLRAEYDQSGIKSLGTPRRARREHERDGLGDDASTEMRGAEEAQATEAMGASSVRMIPCSLCGVRNRVSPNAPSFSCGICKNKNLMLSCQTCGTQAYECKALSGNVATYVCETCHRENPERRSGDRRSFPRETTDRRRSVPD
jgi:curved DNA-binding protein CbpA